MGAHYFMRNLHFLHPDYQKKSKGPFTEYQQEKYNNPNRNFRNTRFNNRNDRFDEERETENAARFDLFDLSNKLRRDQPERQDQNQGFQSQFRSQERSGREQLRYERVSPFNKQQSSPIAERQNFEIEVTVTGPETQLSIDTDESYDLTLLTQGDTTTVTIIASTYYGARHAMESLSQMIAYDELSNSLRVVKTAKVSDEPAFKYRGIMLDTGRNYYPQDVREIVEYANQRGIRVIPELDAPAHAGAGWNFGEKEGLGKLVLCNDPDDVWFDNCKEAPCGQLNPTNPQVYEVLKNVYSDILESFNPEFVHMGGDDTSFKCWNNSPEITNFLTQQNREVNSRELFELWNTFQTTAYNKLSESMQETGISKKVTPMIYSSSFVRNYIDPKEYVVQITEDVNTTSIEQYIAKGYKVIFSN